MAVILKMTRQTPAGSVDVRTRCPRCGREAFFERIQKVPDMTADDGSILGSRRCPNPDCYAPLFFVWKGGHIVETFPPIRIDFDKEGIPQDVLSTLEEAITCHSQKCYRAAAAMVRRTLEEICENCGAGKEDDRLVARIKELESEITVPQKMLAGMEALRFLGNDAAHVKLKHFDKVGEEEVVLAINITKHILNGIYKLKADVDKLEKFKNPQQ